ncbi:hypothetical protein [Pseudonocardia sp. KRD291]|uniref:hypothetical protein n=1 Tax=Pseudonocardia sp. KRD291 TaxID=2792007 RepID=UPI001C4A01E9|nr:hypothetical protein [Pseudonocardia sp. KRD291]MBW0103670.1 hypothetical protein [Pseudonocardia sp. KRD291]
MIREAELFLKAQPVLNEVLGRIRPEDWTIQLPALFDVPGYDRQCSMRATVVRLARDDARVPALLAGKAPEPFDEDPLGEDPHTAAVRCSQIAGDAARAVTDGAATATEHSGASTTVADLLCRLAVVRSFLAHDIALSLGSRACPLPEDLARALWETTGPDAARWRERGIFRAPLPPPPPEVHVSWRDRFLMGAGRDPHPWMHQP